MEAKLARIVNKGFADEPQNPVLQTPSWSGSKFYRNLKSENIASFITKKQLSGLV